MACPFGLSVMVAPVCHGGKPRLLLFSGNWCEVGAEGILDHRLREAGLPPSEQESLMGCIPGAAGLLTNDQVRELREKLTHVVSRVSDLIEIMYEREKAIREHRLAQIVQESTRVLSDLSLPEACDGTGPLLERIRGEFRVQYIVFFTNAGLHSRLDACAAAGVVPKVIAGLHIEGNPLGVARDLEDSPAWSPAQRREWLTTHLHSEGGRGDTSRFCGASMVVPIPLGAAYRGVLVFGPTKEAASTESQLDVEDHASLVVTGSGYLRDGLRDMAQRQELAEMLAKFSHLLRGPLMGVQGQVDVLRAQAGELDKRAVTETADEIQNQVDEMNMLAEHVEQAIITGLGVRADPQFAAAPVSTLISKVWGGMARRARVDRSVGLQIHSSVRSLPQIEFDWPLMRVVFANVLHNALKYSHLGTEIKVTAERIPAGAAPWGRICVADFGVGIAPDEIQEHIYQPNFRGAVKDQMRDIEGVGMGLAICREIVQDIHHGKLWARCTEKGGEEGTYQHCLVEFFVELPCKQDALQLEARR